MKVYFIADTHFDDINILNYESRPFDNVSEMNETIIANWNKTVSDEDKVFMLGDIGNDEYVKRLKGRKFLIKGNHDTKASDYYRQLGFEEVYDLPVIYESFWMLSHEPLYVNNNMPYANIYGHVHGNPNYNDASSHGVCVSVERINYTPIELEKVRGKILGN